MLDSLPSTTRATQATYAKKSFQRTRLGGFRTSDLRPRFQAGKLQSNGRESFSEWYAFGLRRNVTRALVRGLDGPLGVSES